MLDAALTVETPRPEAAPPLPRPPADASYLVAGRLVSLAASRPRPAAGER